MFTLVSLSSHHTRVYPEEVRQEALQEVIIKIVGILLKGSLATPLYNNGCI